MKRLCIVGNTAQMVNENGEVFTAIKESTGWLFKGLLFRNPFEAFMSIERN